MPHAPVALKISQIDPGGVSPTLRAETCSKEHEIKDKGRFQHFCEVFYVKHEPNTFCLIDLLDVASTATFSLLGRKISLI